MKYLKISLGFCLAFWMSLASFAQDESGAGKQLFDQNCKTCHTIGEKVIGPNLEGVTTRRSEEWITNFVKNSAKMIADGDEQAVKIWEEFGKTEMTAFEGVLSDDEIGSLVAYLKVAKPEAKVMETPKNDPITTVTAKAEEEWSLANFMNKLKGEEIIFLALFVFLVATVASVMLVIMLQLAQIIQQMQPEKIENKGLIFRFLELVTFQNVQLFTGVNRDEEIPGHDHDGITELDNTMPPWLAYFFYITIIFAAVYLVNYRVLETGETGAQEYEAEMAQAALIYKDAIKVKVELLTDKGALESGKEIYLQSCASCHKDLGEGGIGPNLTDEYWLHGGKMDAIFNTIRSGVPAKGMIAWKGKLSDQQILEVSSFVKSLQGTNPPNAKAAQGDKE